MNQHKMPRQALILLLVITIISISAASIPHNDNQISIPILLYHESRSQERGRASLPERSFYPIWTPSKRRGMRPSPFSRPSTL